MSATDILRQGGVNIVTMSQFQNNKLRCNKPTLLMIYLDTCGHCVNKAPHFAKVSCPNMDTMALCVNETTKEQDTQLSIITKGVFKGAVPLIATFRADGSFCREITTPLSNTACMKYECVRAE